MLQFYVKFKQSWCVANFIKLSSSKTSVITLTNILYYIISCISHTDIIKDLEELIQNYIFSNM